MPKPNRKNSARAKKKPTRGRGIAAMAKPASNGEVRKIRIPQTAVLKNGEPANPGQTIGSITSQFGLNLAEKVKDLLRLAREQGHLTHEDLNAALPENIATPADLDQVLSKLRNLEIEIVDSAEVER